MPAKEAFEAGKAVLAVGKAVSDGLAALSAVHPGIVRTLSQACKTAKKRRWRSTAASEDAAPAAASSEAPDATVAAPAKRAKVDAYADSRYVHRCTIWYVLSRGVRTTDLFAGAPTVAPFAA